MYCLLMFKHIKQNGVSDFAVAAFWLGFIYREVWDEVTGKTRD